MLLCLFVEIRYSYNNLQETHTVRIQAYRYQVHNYIHYIIFVLISYFKSD